MVDLDLEMNSSCLGRIGRRSHHGGCSYPSRMLNHFLYRSQLFIRRFNDRPLGEIIMAGILEIESKGQFG